MATTNLDSLTLTGDLVVAGNVTVTGDISVDDLTIGDDQTITGDLNVTGVVTATTLKVKDSDASHAVTIAPGNEAADRTLSIPVLGGADTLMTLGTAQTVTGVKTMSGANIITHAPTGLKIQDSNASHLVTIAPGDESADRTLSIPVLGGADTIMTLGTAQTVTGAKTMSGANIITHGAGTGSGTFLASGVISVMTTAVATAANTNETDGFTYTLPANSLSANGKGVRLTLWGSTAANGNNKTLQLYFGGSSVYTTGAVAANAKNWRVEMVILRTGVGGQDIAINGHFDGTLIVASNIVTQTKDETATLVIKNTMTNGTANASDIVTEGAILEFLA